VVEPLQTRLETAVRTYHNGNESALRHITLAVSSRLDKRGSIMRGKIALFLRDWGWLVLFMIIYYTFFYPSDQSSKKRDFFALLLLALGAYINNRLVVGRERNERREEDRNKARNELWGLLKAIFEKVRVIRQAEKDRGEKPERARVRFEALEEIRLLIDTKPFSNAILEAILSEDEVSRFKRLIEEVPKYEKKRPITFEEQDVLLSGYDRDLQSLIVSIRGIEPRFQDSPRI
jgi:hypothetical protein